jgi:hypothetical protein
MMILAAGARVLLALVFSVAAVGKVRDRLGFLRTIADLGVPRALVGPASLATPLAELAVAALLVVPRFADRGALAALALLGTFTLIAVLAMSRGRTSTCACFGGFAPEPIGPVTVVRNAALMAMALLVLDERFVPLATVVFVAAVAALVWHSSRLHQSHARLATRVQELEARLKNQPAPPEPVRGLDVGAPAPPFELPRLEGDRATLGGLLKHGRPLLLIFSDAFCPACGQLWPDIARWQREQAGRVNIAVICGGPDQMIELKLMGAQVSNVLLRGSSTVHDAYQLTTNPGSGGGGCRRAHRQRERRRRRGHQGAGGPAVRVTTISAA